MLVCLRPCRSLLRPKARAGPARVTADPRVGLLAASGEMTQRFTYFDRNGGLILAGMAFGAVAVGLFKLVEWLLGW